MSEQDLYKSLTDAYAMMYEKDNRSAKEKQSAENSFDAYQAETGETKSKKKWDKEQKDKASKPKSAAERMAAAHDKREVERWNKYSKKEETHWLGQGGYSKESMNALGDAYASMYENRMAAMTAGQSDAKKSMQSKPAKVTGGKAYTMKGKDGKPLFGEEAISEGDLEQAKKNVGADSCWDGYKAKGTKMKDGKSVPNCVKEEELPEEYAVSDENHLAIMEGKKKCKDGYYYCSDDKKCKKEKSKKSTTIIGGRYGYGGHDHDDDDNENGDGGDGGGGDGGGGGE